MRLTPIQKKIAWAIGLTAGTAGVVTAVAVATRKKVLVSGIAPSAFNPAAVSQSAFSPMSAAKEKLKKQQAFVADYMSKMLGLQGAIAFKTAVIVDEATFRNLYWHGDGFGDDPNRGAGALNLVDLFYKNGQLNFDEIANQAHCQTAGAAIGNKAYDFYNWFSLHSCYQISMKDDPSGFQACVDAVVEGVIQRSLAKRSINAIAEAAQKAGIGSGPAEGPGMFYIDVPAGTIMMLKRFASDMLARSGKLADLPTTDKDGNPLEDPLLTLVHASIGAGMISQFITKLTSHDAKENPCIRELDAGMVFEMAASTIGVVFGLVLGPALSGVSTIVKIVTTINKLAELGK